MAEEFDFEPMEVVISGVGGYFPKAENMEQLKEVLLSNEILLGSRWKEGERGVSSKIGMCPSIQYFDTAFFGIHRQQAIFMDPMQRLILERTFEAIVDAGVNPQDIRGKRIGVYMGSSIGENDNLFYESIVSGFGVTGHSRAMMPNRVSYWLNLKGPSCAYDSNWINGIEVLQLGFDAVRNGHCEAAIIGTANMALNSELSWLYNDMGLLSADGSTKAFDVEATGYARSDGIVVMFLQRAMDAKRSYATIVNTATMFNGNRDGPLLDLDQPSMIQFLEDFYKRCPVDPKDVDFVECYGCALKKTDEYELNALDAVYCKNRKKPLMIGSVKTNSGHSEASATLSGIAKVLVAMETGKIPATLQYKTPNPRIKGLVDGRLQVITENTDWSGGYAAVNGIGLTSAYAHVLLKSNTKKKVLVEDNIPRLAIASTRTEPGLVELLDTIKNQPKLDPEYIALTQELFSKTIAGHLYRGYVVLDQSEEVKQETEYYPGKKRQTWFCYSGMGSQWATMGKDLMSLPIFAETIMKCHRALEPHGVDLLHIITTPDKAIFENILHSFVGIAAVQIALTDILYAIGVVPDGIIGHSVGELGCAYADKCLTAEQMILCAYSRGKASIEASLIRGMMAAIGLGYEQIKNQVPESIEVACHNGADSSTISGPTEDMEKYVAELQAKGIFAKLVNVSNIAYHSRYIKPAAPFLLKYLKNVIPVAVARSPRWVSTSVHESKWDSDLAKTSSAEYHTNNLLSSVLFEEGSQHIPKDSVVIEIAPHGLLQAILKRSLKSGCTNIPLTQRGSKNGVSFLLAALGKIYLAGLDVNLTSLFPKVEFPVSVGTTGLAPLVHWEHGEVWRTGIEDKLNYLLSVKDVQISIEDEEYNHCIGHQLDGNIVLPMSAIFKFLINILSTSSGHEVNEVVFENLRFKNIVIMPKIGKVPLYAMIQKGSGEFEVLTGNTLIATGKITESQSSDKLFDNVDDLTIVTSTLELSGDDVYNEFIHRKQVYNGFYKTIANLTIAEEGSLVHISGKQTWQTYLEAMLQQYYFHHGEKYQHICMLTQIQRIVLSLPAVANIESDTTLSYHYYTDVLFMEGIQISRLQTTAMSLEKHPMVFDTIDLVPLQESKCDNIETMIGYSMQLTSLNFNGVLSNNFMIHEIVTDPNKAIVENIRNVLNKYIQINANVNSTTDTKVAIVSQADPVLIVINDSIVKDVVSTITNSDAFLLCRSTKDLLDYKNLIAVTHFDVKGMKYTLLKKSTKCVPKIVKCTSNAPSTKDVLNLATPWAKELHSAMQNIKPHESIYLLLDVIPIDGILNFVQILKSTQLYSKIRFAFKLDRNAPEFKANEPFYDIILKQDNHFFVVKDGTISTCLPTCMDFKTNLVNHVQLSSCGGSDMSLRFVGINVNDETLNPSENSPLGLSNIDYVGMTGNQKHVMGLATLDNDSHDLIFDPILKWEVPKTWSSEEACSVPHAYATAYHALVQKAELKKGETVLVHGGCSALGLAAIAIASSFNCKIFTTVATDTQRATLMKTYSNLRENNILSSEDTNFEPLVLQDTNGIGAQVILNCVRGQMLHSTVRCLAEFGRIVQIGKFDNRENNTIGMSVFLKNTSLIGAVPEFIMDDCDEDKEYLRQLVQQGLDNAIVKPLCRKVVINQDIGSILTDLKKKDNIGKIIIQLENGLPLNQLNIENPNQFICDSKSQFLIFGGTHKQWVDLVEWLVLRGARKIIVASDVQVKQADLKRRLSLMKQHFKTQITYADVSNLAPVLDKCGPIKLALVLPDDRDIKLVANMETVLRQKSPKTLLVSFKKDVANVLFYRFTSGNPTIFVMLDTDLNFEHILNGLDDILSFGKPIIILRNNTISDVDQETPQALNKKLALLLPSTSTEILTNFIDAPDEPELTQLPSYGPRRIRELPPVIIVPGLSAQDTMRKFAMELLYPIFCTELPCKHVSIKEAATIFADKIHKLYERGPYNIIGISWGGVLAIEISKILQKYHNTQVTLLDAAPDTIQAALKHLGESTHVDVNLLAKYLNISNSDVIKNLNNLPTWDARLEEAIKNYECLEEDRSYLRDALTLLRKQIDDLVEYEADDEVLTGEIHLIRPTGSSKFNHCGLTKVSKQVPQLHISTGDHVTMLTSQVTLDIVNDGVAVV